MQTLFEYRSELASLPEYRIHRPDACQTFMASVEHKEDDDDEILLETIFSLCNRGSRHEHPQFDQTPIPSLSLGDCVKLGCNYRGEPVRIYRCEAQGWTKLF
jgi:hypothetical protein